MGVDVCITADIVLKNTIIRTCLSLRVHTCIMYVDI